jgi:hypothetical protein
MCWTHPYRVGLIVTVQYSTINMNRECAIDSGRTGVNGVAPPVVGVHVCTTSKGVFLAPQCMVHPHWPAIPHLEHAIRSYRECAIDSGRTGVNGRIAPTRLLIATRT